MNFMKKIWNDLLFDEYGFTVNNFLKTIAKLILILGCIISLLVAFFLASVVAKWGKFSAALFVFITTLIVVFAIFLTLSFILLWFASIGDNVAHIRQDAEKANNEEISE